MEYKNSKKTMNIKLTKSLEDYIETIYMFEKKNGFSRVKEIANFLNVKLPSVNKALKELEKGNLINHEKYGYIKLTKEGKKIAENVFNIHNELVELFKLLGFSDESSFKYGCCLEHVIDEDDKSKVSSIIKKMKNLKEQSLWL